jgi:hypothetical protein
MLKVYSITDYVSIDGSDWREVGYGGHHATDKELPDTIVNHWSFDELLEYLGEKYLSGVKRDETLFGHKPIIYVNYIDAWDWVEYRRFKTLSYKRTFKEWNDVTLEWIMKNLSADECIQYLKDRGMTACPIMK